MDKRTYIVGKNACSITKDFSGVHDGLGTILDWWLGIKAKAILECVFFGTITSVRGNRPCVPVCAGRDVTITKTVSLCRVGKTRETNASITYLGRTSSASDISSPKFCPCSLKNSLVKLSAPKTVNSRPKMLTIYRWIAKEPHVHVRVMMDDLGKGKEEKKSTDAYLCCLQQDPSSDSISQSCHRSP